MLPITHKAPNEQDIITSFNESYISFLIKLTIMIGSGDPNNPTSYAGIAQAAGFLPWGIRYLSLLSSFAFIFHSFIGYY